MKKLEIKELQEVLFEALSYVDSVCRKNNIRYYLAYGTLLGAIRGNDFIPWDPDVDLFMTRDNYTKFCQAMKNEKNDVYFLDTVKTNPHSVAPLEARVCIKGTYIRWDIKERVPLRHEIRIDIMPLDYSSLDTDFVIRRNLKLKVYEQLIHHKYMHVINRKRVISYLFDFMLKALPYKMTLNRLLKLAGTAHDIDKDHYICLSSAYDCDKEKPLRNVYSVEWFKEPEYHMFHGREFPCLTDSHQFLRHYYGDDYMTPIEREEDGEYYLL